MEHFLNDHTIAEAMEMLCADLPTEDAYDGSVYIPVDEVRRRVAEVLSPQNYDFLCPVPSVSNVCGNHFLIGEATLLLRDDDGMEIKKVIIPVSLDIDFKTEQPEVLANKMASVVSSYASRAFSKAWQMLGVGGGQVSCGKKSKKTAEKGKKDTQCQWYTVEFLSNMTGNDRRVSAGVRTGGAELELVILKSGIEWMAQAYGKNASEIVTCLTSNYGSGKKLTTMRVYGIIQEYNGKKQLLFYETVPPRKEADR